MEVLVDFIIQDQAENLAAQIGELLLTTALFTLRDAWAAIGMSGPGTQQAGLPAHLILH